MKTLTIANQKGGVGKSTIAINIFNYCIEKGLKTIFIDFDPQGNSSKVLLKAHPGIEANNTTLDLIKRNDLNFSDATDCLVFSSNSKLADNIEGEDLLKSNLQLLDQYYDICIIDTPPTASYLQVKPLMLSDYVISPIELHSWSYDGSIPFLTMLGNIRKHNQSNKPVFLGLIPNRVWLNSPKQKADLEQFLNNPKLKDNLFGKGDYYIPMRHAYIESGETGKPVWSFKNKSSARAEGKNIKNICKHVLKLMETEV